MLKTLRPNWCKLSLLDPVKMMRQKKLSLVILLNLFIVQLNAAELRVAVASNFLPALLQLKQPFKNISGHDLLISSASTGQIFAQITQAAPFDVFMAADVKRPALLEEAGRASDLTVYAQGQLVLLSNITGSQPCEQVLRSSQLQYISMANPDLAPYGAAAKQFLQQQHLWQALQGKRVVGENVAQALQLIVSQNATAGLVAASLLSTFNLRDSQCVWPVPLDQYEPINQAMVFILSSDKRMIFDEFKSFLATSEAQQILRNSGYLLPGAE